MIFIIWSWRLGSCWSILKLGNNCVGSKLSIKSCLLVKLSVTIDISGNDLIDDVGDVSVVGLSLASLVSPCAAFHW